MRQEKRLILAILSEEKLEIAKKTNQELAVLDDLVIPDYVNQTMLLKRREEFKKTLSIQYSGFPDVHRTIEDIIAEGDKVWVRVKITGTHTGKYRGLAPTSKKFVMATVPMYRVVEGKIIEGWSVWNRLGLFKQLGVIEYKGFPDESPQK